MKIAFIVQQFPSISQTFILRQIVGLLDRGHEVHIFASNAGTGTVVHPDIEKYNLLKRTYYFGAGPSRGKVARVLKRLGLLITNFHKHPRAILRAVNVARLGRDALYLRALYYLIPFLDKDRYDILHCQFGHIGNLGLLLRDAGLLYGKLVTSFRGADIASYAKLRRAGMYRDLFSRGDLFLCVSEHIREKLLQHGCDRKKIIVHRSGAEIKQFDLPAEEPRSNGKVRILTIARLVEKKGVEYGIRAVAETLKGRSHIEYRVAGEGPLRGGLQYLIEDLKAGDNIKLLGWKNRAEIMDLLRELDILLAPSVTAKTGDEEGIPGVIMEAFAHGVPVVSTYHAGIPEVVKDGHSGFLVPERDTDALAERLEQLIRQPSLRAAMGRNGRVFVQEHYDIDKLNDRLVKIYQQLLDGELPPVATQLETVSCEQ
jgi:colanic acid/amylovoran biosynthesis glycosyltransferase